MDKTIKIQVRRYLPEKQPDPFWQEYEVPLEPKWGVLDALIYIKDHLDGSLSYRWSCHMGVCGSCGMMVNGEPALTCATFLEEYQPGPIRIEPLANFKVLRDLIIDTDDFMGKLKSVKPWLITDEKRDITDGENRQTPAELKAFKQYTLCINCMLCYSACPVVGLNEDFVGPAAIALAQRYNYDNRDSGNAARHDTLLAHGGAFDCTLIGECSRACPKHVDPTGAIQRYKADGAMEYWKRLIWPKAATAPKNDGIVKQID